MRCAGKVEEMGPQRPRKSGFPGKVSLKYDKTYPTLARALNSEEIVPGGGLFSRIILTVVHGSRDGVPAQSYDHRISDYGVAVNDSKGISQPFAAPVLSTDESSWAREALGQW